MSKYGLDDDDLTLDIPKPKAKKPKPTKADTKAAAEQGESLGFTDRSPAKAAAKPVKRAGGRRKAKEPQDRMLIAGPQRVLNAFRSHCDEQDLSYWEAIEQLLGERKS